MELLYSIMYNLLSTELLANAENRTCCEFHLFIHLYTDQISWQILTQNGAKSNQIKPHLFLLTTTTFNFQVKH